MTRLEKYRQYRNEIANMKFDSSSEKEQTAKEVEKIQYGGSGRKLNYEQVMVVHESMSDGTVNFKRQKYIGLTKYEIFYFLIAIVFVIILVVSLVLVGVKLWR